MVLPSGDTSSDIHVASLVSNRITRGGPELASSAASTAGDRAAGTQPLGGGAPCEWAWLVQTTDERSNRRQLSIVRHGAAVSAPSPAQNLA